MRQILVTVAVVLLASAMAYSQLESVTLDVTQVNGMPTTHITNNGTEPIEALLVTEDAFGPAGDGHRTYFDIHMLSHTPDQPVQPGGTKNLPLVGTPGGPLPQIRLLAAIFSDGSTEGSEGAVKELLRRRAIAIDQLDNLRRVLSGAIQDRLPALSTKTRFLDSVMPTRKITPPAGYRWEDIVLEEQIQGWAVDFLDSRTTPFTSAKPESHVVVQQLSRVVDSWLSDLLSAKPTLKPNDTEH